MRLSQWLAATVAAAEVETTEAVAATAGSFSRFTVIKKDATGRVASFALANFSPLLRSLVPFSGITNYYFDRPSHLVHFSMVKRRVLICDGCLFPDRSLRRRRPNPCAPIRRDALIGALRVEEYRVPFRQQLTNLVSGRPCVSIYASRACR
jgi:hypothetical protein